MSDIEWRETWPERDLAIEKEDYIAAFEGDDIGRVYQTFTGSRGNFWMWFAWFDVLPHSGTADSRREAMLAIEERFEEWRKEHK